MKTTMAQIQLKQSHMHFILIPWKDRTEKDKAAPMLELYGYDSAFGWRLVGVNGETMCGAFDGDGFSTANGAWRSACKSASYLASTDTIALANVYGTPMPDTDLALVHVTRGTVLRIRRVVSA